MWKQQITYLELGLGQLHGGLKHGQDGVDVQGLTCSSLTYWDFVGEEEPTCKILPRLPATNYLRAAAFPVAVRPAVARVHESVKEHDTVVLAIP